MSNPTTEAAIKQAEESERVNQPTAVQESKQPESTETFTAAELAERLPLAIKQAEQAEVKQPIPPMKACGGYYCDEGIGHVDCAQRTVEQPAESFHTQALAIVKRHTAKADVNAALVDDIARELKMASVRVWATLQPETVSVAQPLIAPDASASFSDWINREDSGDIKQLERCWYAALASRVIDSDAPGEQAAPVADPFDDAPVRQEGVRTETMERWEAKLKTENSVAEEEAEKAALLPCPFCGRSAQVVIEDTPDGDCFVRCDTEGCWATIGENYDGDAMPNHMFKYEDGPGKAAATWNRRASINPASLSAERCAEVLNKVQWEGHSDWRIAASFMLDRGEESYVYTSEPNDRISLPPSTARIIAAHAIEHGGLVREGEAK